MHSTIHRVPIANGYSGFLPKQWLKLRRQIRDGAFNQRFLDQLAEHQISHIVVRLDQFSPQHLSELLALDGVDSCYMDQRYQIFVLR